MSASLYYQTVTGTRLGVGAPSSFMDAMKRVFGHGQPWVFTESDCFTLRGLAAGLESTDQVAAVNELLRELEKGQEVRLWAEY